MKLHDGEETEFSDEELEELAVLDIPLIKAIDDHLEWAGIAADSDEWSALAMMVLVGALLRGGHQLPAKAA